MDYSVGSVAALISGNVTPNRPRLIKRALTPTKHQPSPNVTPKSEFVDDRSIFLSPSLQKKKAIVKKSPKRIFQNPDLDFTNDGESSSVLLSPKAEKVKKHLKDDLESDQNIITSPKSPKSPKKGKGKLNKPVETAMEQINENSDHEMEPNNVQAENERTPKKKKKNKSIKSEPVEEEKENLIESNIQQENSPKSSKRKRKSDDFSVQTNNESIHSNNDEGTTSSPKKKKKNKAVEENNEEVISQKNNSEQQQPIQSLKKKNKNKKKKSQQPVITTEEIKGVSVKKELIKKKNKAKSVVNPNAITNEDTDSEHESDNEIESENEKINNEVLNTGPVESESSDDEDDTKKETKKPKKQKIEREESSEEEVKRTLFVGNVPFSKKCKKEVKKIFSKYGDIETVRIRTIPVKDGRVTPKLAIIKNELHPERSTVNVYVKFKHADSVEKALVENNTVLNDYHLRVTRSEVTGQEHDPRKAIFVGNLPFSIEDDTLRTKFESCGAIESVRIIRDKVTNAGKGFGYVNFASKDGVELALAMSEEDLTIKNRILRVKRCSLHPSKGQRNDQGNTQFAGRNQGKQGQERSQSNQRPFQGKQRQNGPPGRSQCRPGQMTGRNQGSQGRNQGYQGRNQGNQGRNQGNHWRNQGNQERKQGSQGRNQGNVGRNQGNPGRGNFGDRNQVQEGAYRRILKKREKQDPSGGPPDKRPKELNQPAKEKKPRKEFVGMTSEKKKKRKFDKGQKKKRAISEILTKNKDTVK